MGFLKSRFLQIPGCQKPCPFLGRLQQAFVCLCIPRWLDLLHHYSLSKILKVLQAFYRQLWCLTGELIPLAILAKGGPSSELEAGLSTRSARATPAPAWASQSSKTSLCSEVPTPLRRPSQSLSRRTPWLFLNWLLLPAETWPLFPPYQRLVEFIRNISVSNDLAKRVSNEEYLNDNKQ